MSQLRKDFEEWAENEGHPIDRFYDRYSNPDTEISWIAWQACRACYE